MKKLRECPFCGGEVMIWESPVFGLWFIKCRDCLASMMHEDKNKLMKNWNARHEPPYNGSVPAGNERLSK